MGYSPEQLSDIQCIRDCALRYCRGVGRLDVDLMKSAYWPDATDDHGVFAGNAMEFAAMCMQAHLKWEQMAIDAASFRQGSFDRPSAGRTIGP